VTDHAGLVSALDAVVPTLGDRGEPLLLEVAVEPDPTFAP
jgi:benzoylformate decarboxylase